MKYFILFIMSTGLLGSAFGQAAWIEPDNPDVTQPIRLYVDLSKTTNTSCASVPGPFYIWTWKPFDRPTGDPLVNGTGDKPWKNSNEALKMTKDATKGDKVWYYEMVPTDFYSVPAGTVYSNGISFLVKPKDGGGYGDPDVKTEDFNLTVSPPQLTRGTIYQFPSILLDGALANIIYNNPVDTNPGMKNLADGDAYMWIQCTVKDTVSGATKVYQIESFFGASDNPALKMTKNPVTGMFSLTFVPKDFFGFKANEIGKEIECTVRRKNYTSAADRSPEQPKFKFGCN